jgi:hypothetical protein
MVYNIAPKNKGVGYVFTTGGGFKIFNGRQKTNIKHSNRPNG